MGFFRVDLFADDEGRRFVVHCWPREFRSTQDPAWTVHCHAWPVESMILTGRLRDTQFVHEAADERIPPGVLYLAGSAPDGMSELKRTGEAVRLAGSVDAYREEREFYEIGLDAFHESVVGARGHCMTLARIGRRKVQPARVVGEPGAPALLRYHHEAVARQLLRDEFRAAGLTT
ncbi:hypothetical protein [Actinoplanes sp. CA-252034]|uniref:hypothetical protein n=1 Tax=Actinoplanes sp. CA-252034 TaxID=3239906 RepID=UPI003D95F053